MRIPAVRDVMTRRVVAVRGHAGYKEMVDALTGYGVSALPVVDEETRVVGLVSEADLLPKVEFAGDDPRAGLLARRARRTARAKAGGDTAADLMTAPAVTVDPDTTVVAAARLMESEAVKRLPVVDGDGRLVGIVARSDLLRVFLRGDGDIRAEVEADVLGRTLAIEPSDVDVEVRAGVVRLRGRVDRSSTARIAVRLTRAVTGVVDVLDGLGYGYDDEPDLNRRYLFDAEV
jgi:CBS domain-containing protein